MCTLDMQLLFGILTKSKGGKLKCRLTKKVFICYDSEAPHVIGVCPSVRVAFLTPHQYNVVKSAETKKAEKVCGLYIVYGTGATTLKS